MDGPARVSSGLRAARVRRALPEDARALAEIYNRAIEERIATFETESRSESTMRAWIREHDDRHPVLVAEATDDEPSAHGGFRVVAWASIATYRPRACYAGFGEFSIYVRDGYRGQGIGQRLLESLVDEARGLG